MLYLAHNIKKILLGGDLNAKHNGWNACVNNPKGSVFTAHADRQFYSVVVPVDPTHYIEMAIEAMCCICSV